MARFHQAFSLLDPRVLPALLVWQPRAWRATSPGKAVRPIEADAIRGRGECNRGARTPCLLVTHV
jgi:hypothetical protein